MKVSSNKPRQRYDSIPLKAEIDENGFLNDTPVVARTGLYEYQMPDGTTRREFRPASEVFSWESLSSYQGKPITLGHVVVNSENAKDVVVGSCCGSAYQQWDSADDAPGIGVMCPVTIYDQYAIDQAVSKLMSELSVGYTTIDIEGHGWGNIKTGEYFFSDDRRDLKEDDLLGFQQSSDWVEFDAVQTTIRVNHLALVYRGRAGIAKLNLDSEQEFPYDAPVQTTKEDSIVTKIKLDSGDEVEVTPEVAAHVQALETKISTAQAEVVTVQSRADSIEAERDNFKLKVDSIPALIAEAVEKAKSDAACHAELVSLAAEAGVKTDGLEPKAIKVAYVKAVLGTDISAKSDAFIDTSFELARDSDKMAAQRLSVTGANSRSDEATEVTIPNPQDRFRKPRSAK